MQEAFFRRLLGSQGCADAWRLLGASIAENALVGRSVWMRIPSNVSVGPGCRLAGAIVLDSWDEISFGENVLVNSAKFFSGQHDIDNPYHDGITGPIHVGRYVWVVSEVIVLPGVTIGDCAVVGTGAVVTKDVAPYAVVGGNPATFLRERARIEFRYVPSSDDWRENSDAEG
jgi:putative colanic acid biosynthesis acetyltransferase WcaF